MRLGVSGKILVAYTAMAAVFLTSSVLTLVYMHRARHRVVASQLLFDIQTDVDASWRALGHFSTTSAASTRRPDPRRAHAVALAESRLGDALHAVDGYLKTPPGFPNPPDVPRYRREMAELRVRVAQAAAGLGPYEASQDEEKRLAYESTLATLISRLDRVKRDVRGGSSRIATQLRDDEENAQTLAMGLALFGLVVVLAVAGSMVRTLRPLLTLRRHAREIAGGDYDQRINVNSHDEIGELAREFDAMAIAVKEREQRLVQSERLATIGQMAAHITHEIRNPLASIGLNAELLGDEFGKDAPEARRLVAAIAAEVDRLSEISETYLKFVRMPRGDRQAEDLGAIVSSVLEFARAELQRSNVELSIAIDEGVPEILAEESQIRQAILNLVRNAREAMAAGGRLEVRVFDDGKGGTCARVRDTGPGVEPENLSRIFDPFFSTKKKGTGLGLLLVQQIVTDHGGSVTVANAEGGGTVFQLVFPALKAQGAATAAAQGAVTAATPVIETEPETEPETATASAATERGAASPQVAPEPGAT